MILRRKCAQIEQTLFEVSSENIYNILIFSTLGIIRDTATARLARVQLLDFFIPNKL